MKLMKLFLLYELVDYNSNRIVQTDILVNWKYC